MATKASGTLVLIIEKQHASWDLMVTASPALELWLWCHLRIAPIYSEHCDGCASDNDKVHKRASHGHQGIRNLGPHHIVEACSMGPHG